MPGARTRIKNASVQASIRELTGRGGYVPIVTGRRRGIGVTEHPFPQPPDNWKGTLPEWAIYWAHLTLGRKADEDFFYLWVHPFAPNGIDFFEPAEQIGIEIQGLFWHYGFGRDKQFSDAERKVLLEGAGIQMIFIDEDDAVADPIYYLKEAILGRDHSLAARGLT